MSCLYDLSEIKRFVLYCIYYTLSWRSSSLHTSFNQSSPGSSQGYSFLDLNPIGMRYFTLKQTSCLMERDINFYSVYSMCFTFLI